MPGTNGINPDFGNMNVGQIYKIKGTNPDNNKVNNVPLYKSQKNTTDTVEITDNTKVLIKVDEDFLSLPNIELPTIKNVAIAKGTLEFMSFASNSFNNFADEGVRNKQDIAYYKKFRNKPFEPGMSLAQNLYDGLRTIEDNMQRA